MDTFCVLREIIAEKFKKDPSIITLDTTLETLVIDSLDTFEIVFDAEKVFDIKVPDGEVAVDSVKDLVTLIDSIRAK